MSWQIILSKQAKKDAKKIAASGLKPKAQKILTILQNNPYQPPYEKLIGNLEGYYSRRINIQREGCRGNLGISNRSFSIA